jgi:hypothetical protein
MVRQAHERKCWLALIRRLIGPVILFQDVIEVLRRSMLAGLLQNTLVFELHNRRRVSGMLVGVDDSRRRMVCSAERFGQEALGRGRVLLGREKEVEGRAGPARRATPPRHGRKARTAGTSRPRAGSPPVQTGAT